MKFFRFLFRTTLPFFFFFAMFSSQAIAGKVNKVEIQAVDDYTTSVTFPANFAVGDYIEFVGVAPAMAGASGLYEIFISYTRGSIAAAAVHLAAISHANPDVWRETGRINDNKYVSVQRNFTIDCNGASYNPRFRIRAINTFGTNDPMTVLIKVTSKNFNNSFTPLSTTGSDLTVNKFQPMTEEWDLYVGNLFSTNGASLAIKALMNGNVGIGIANPQEKLAVNGNIRAKEIKVETANWPDYVFADDYDLKDIKTLEKYIRINKHLPEMPSAKEAEENGIALGQINNSLVKKVEELTLYLIEKDRQVEVLQSKTKNIEAELVEIKKQLKQTANKKL